MLIRCSINGPYIDPYLLGLIMSIAEFIIATAREKNKKITIKKGMRALGIAESFNRDIHKSKSIIAGVIMRGDLQIDGIAFETVSIGGLDATDSIIKMYQKLNREDIRIILLSGTVIAYYNVVDLQKLFQTLKRPIIAVTYEESQGIDNFLLEMPNGELRLQIHRRNGRRIPIHLRNSFTVYIRNIGISVEDAETVLNLFTIHGRFPEPIRVAKLLSHELLKFLWGRGNLINNFSTPTS